APARAWTGWCTARRGGSRLITEVLGLERTAVADVLALLRTRSATVATAESLTAGLVTAALTDVPGSSEVVRGGLVVYATDLKAWLADVDQAVLAERGPVDPAVARMLAMGAQFRCGADWGIGLTGVAGPAAQDGVAPGTMHIGVAWNGGAQVRTE